MSANWKRRQDSDSNKPRSIRKSAIGRRSSRGSFDNDPMTLKTGVLYDAGHIGLKETCTAILRRLFAAGLSPGFKKGTNSAELTDPPALGISMYLYATKASFFRNGDAAHDPRSRSSG
jgi:hypothetical protein